MLLEAEDYDGVTEDNWLVMILFLEGHFHSWIAFHIIIGDYTTLKWLALPHNFTNLEENKLTIEQCIIK